MQGKEMDDLNAVLRYNMALQVFRPADKAALTNCCNLLWDGTAFSSP